MLKKLTKAIGISCCMICSARGQQDVRLTPPIAPENQPYVDCLERAIDVLEKIGFVEGPHQKDAKKAAKRLSAALAGGRVSLTDRDIGGAVTGGTQDAKKELLIHRDRFPKVPPCDWCDPSFATLLGTLFHEAIHFGQDTTLVGGATPTADQRWENKLRMLERECEAHAKANAFRQDLRGLLDAMAAAHRRNKILQDPPWVERYWGDCTPEQIEKLIQGLNAELIYFDVKTGALSKVLDKKTWTRDFKLLEKNCGKTIQEQLKCLCEDKSLREIGHYTVRFDGQEERISFTVGSFDAGCLLTGSSRFVPLEFPLGIVSVQDAVPFEDADGNPWLLAAGNDASTGSPRLRAIALSKNALGQIVPGASLELADPLLRLRSVTAVARRNDGKMYVFERATRQVLRLEDTNADGVPDQVGAPSAALPGAGVMDDMVALRTDGTNLILMERAFFTVFDNARYVVLQDPDDDGDYDRFLVRHPSEVPDRPPAFLGDAVSGARSIGLAGAHGHQLVLFAGQQPGGQILAQGQVPAFPEDSFIAPTSRPLQSGESVLLVDLTNNRTSEVRVVGPRLPVVYETSPARVRPGERTVVTLRGTGYELIRGVAVDGKKADIVSQSPEEVRIRTSKLHLGPRWIIEFELPDGDQIESAVSLFPESETP